VTLAAVVAAFLGYALGAGIDWMWEMTIVSVVAFACLGLMVGPATAREGRPRLAEPGERPPRSRYGLGIATLVGGWLLICAIALPLLAGFKLRASQADAANGNLAAAVNDAADARDIEPWAFSPYLQLALLQEDAGNLGLARAAIQKAIRRDHLNWELWLVAARIQTKQGAIAQARRSLKRARTLNPRSPLFSTGKPATPPPSGPSLAKGKAARTVRDAATGSRLRFVFYDTVGDVPASVVGSEPEAGFRYVAVKLGVANLGKTAYESNLAQRITVTDADGTVHRPQKGGVEPRLGRLTLAAGRAVVGFLTFSIPESVSLSSIEIKPFGAGNATAHFSLG
jgi:tetratricopeptide (TPR) repeat protein